MIKPQKTSFGGLASHHGGLLMSAVGAETKQLIGAIDLQDWQNDRARLWGARRVIDRQILSTLSGSLKNFPTWREQHCFCRVWNDRTKVETIFLLTDHLSITGTDRRCQHCIVLDGQLFDTGHSP